jgi:hypothetical protein
MSDWKQTIEAQIADLRNSCYLLDEHGAEIGVSEHAASMQALLDVAVAAENSMFWLHNGIVSMQKEEWDKIVDALDKLREVGDENP